MQSLEISDIGLMMIDRNLDNLVNKPKIERKSCKVKNNFKRFSNFEAPEEKSEVENFDMKSDGKRSSIALSTFLRRKNGDDSITDNFYFTPDQEAYYEMKVKENQPAKIKRPRIKEWKIIKQIGQGSFGKVFYVFDTTAGRPMAMKQLVLPDDSIKNRKKLNDLQMEIEFLSKLNHEKIVEYFGYQRDKEFLNIFLEYVGGGSLESLLNLYGGLKEKIISNYTKQILEGLEYLHTNKIIHRDIKAANILVNKGVCKLTDFGASKQIFGSIGKEKFNSFIGTPYWMAPEVVMQKGHGRFADIWSLGCTVYEMLTGLPPFADKNEYAALFTIAQECSPPKYPDGISDELYHFLDCCFQRNPTDRCNVYELKRHPFILQEDFVEETCCILKGGLTKLDQEFIKGNKDALKSTQNTSANIQTEDTKSIEVKPSSSKNIFLQSSKSIEETPVSKAQIQVIYQLVEQGKLQLNDAMKILPRSEVQKILVMYKKISQEETTKTNQINKNHNFKRDKRGLYGVNISNAQRKHRKSSWTMMDNIKEESDDCGTPTPGRLALDRTYTYHNSDQILMESIPARSVKSLVVHNLNQLSINIEPQKSESCTPKQTNAIIESAPPHEEVKDAESSLNESDFDNYESISDDDHNESSNIKLKRDNIEEELKRQMGK